MNIFKKMLGSDDVFYNLLEASAVEAETSVQMLIELLNNKEKLKNKEFNDLSDLYQAGKKKKHLHDELTEHLCTTFVTPLDREDIDALSMALYRIPKFMEKFVKKYLIAMNRVEQFDFSRQLDIIKKTTNIVSGMVKDLRHKRSNLDKIKEQNGLLHHLEGDADKAMLELLNILFCGGHDPLDVIIVMDLYETLEKGIDRCRDAGNVIFQIILKYS